MATKKHQSKTFVSKAKSIFSRHGILETIVSDNQPRYSSEECKQFALDHHFTHNTISRSYLHSGGLGEINSSDSKKHSQECKANGQDRQEYLALLDYRNTPINGVSPAQAALINHSYFTLYAVSQTYRPSYISHCSSITALPRLRNN